MAYTVPEPMRCKVVQEKATMNARPRLQVCNLKCLLEKMKYCSRKSVEFVCFSVIASSQLPNTLKTSESL